MANSRSCESHSLRLYKKHLRSSLTFCLTYGRQIADLHYSVGHGECRDTPKQNCVGDDDTQDLLGRMLDEEKPDLVVFTGDQLNGQESSWDAKSVIAKVTGLMIDRKIPWTAIFGEPASCVGDPMAVNNR
jgi:predicted MPP superfamily phosphohydrolase